MPPAYRLMPRRTAPKRALQRPGAGKIRTGGGVAHIRALIALAVARDPAQAILLSGTWHRLRGSRIGMAVDPRVPRHDHAARRSTN